ALAACFVPLDVLLNATGSTLAFSYGFIAVAALVARRTRSGEAPGIYRMPAWPLAPLVALVAIATIFVIGILDPGQWLSLGIAMSIVAAGFLYYAVYLRRNPATAHLLSGADDDEVAG
ncbi:MAG: APC family permease, partial [Microbacterium sp.]